MARRTKEEAEMTRQAVLDSALNIFYEKGFSRTTFDEIAKRINLTKGAVYWHFRNKADLLADLIREKLTAKDNEFSLLLKKEGLHEWPSTIEELRKMILLDAQAIERDTEFCKFLFFMIFQMEWSEAILQKVTGKLRQIRDYPLTELKQALTFLQKGGEITPETNIDDLASILLCLWRGNINVYTSKAYPLILSHNIIAGFDLIMDNVKVEKK